MTAPTPKPGDVMLHVDGRAVGVVGPDGRLHTHNMSFTPRGDRWSVVGNLEDEKITLRRRLTEGTDPAGQTAPTLRRRLGGLRAARRRAFGCCTGDRPEAGRAGPSCHCDCWALGEGP